VSFPSWIVLGSAILFFAGLGLGWAIASQISRSVYGLGIPALLRPRLRSTKLTPLPNSNCEITGAS
jgi:hypothetical protein